MQAHVIDSDFPVFLLEKLTLPYINRKDALKAAEAFVVETGEDEEDYAPLRFTAGLPKYEIAAYISFLEL